MGGGGRGEAGRRAVGLSTARWFGKALLRAGELAELSPAADVDALAIEATLVALEPPVADGGGLGRLVGHRSPLLRCHRPAS
eukprot:12046538-Alexandrium_andersonii.AAC.1